MYVTVCSGNWKECRSLLFKDTNADLSELVKSQQERDKKGPEGLTQSGPGLILTVEFVYIRTPLSYLLSLAHKSYYLRVQFTSEVKVRDHVHTDSHRSKRTNFNDTAAKVSEATKKI